MCPRLDGQHGRLLDHSWIFLLLQFGESVKRVLLVSPLTVQESGRQASVVLSLLPSFFSFNL